VANDHYLTTARDHSFLSVAVTGDKYCIFGRVQGGIEHYLLNVENCCGELGIWQTGPWNLEKFAVENCGP